MGKGDPKERKTYKASSSAQAAEFLARGGAGGGAGFGGFSGSTPAIPSAVPGFAFGSSVAARLGAQAPASDSVDAPANLPAQQPDVSLSSQLDGEIAQCLRHLSKKDSVTKLKALQNLRSLIKTKSATDLIPAIPPWIFLYQRLSQDSHRGVRSEASATLGDLVTAVGNAIAPHVKSLLGPWWLAQFDPYSEAAASARTAFQACFPGRKQYDALLYGCSELMTFLVEQATANAQQLGDARKDTPEEMEERYERVVSAALLALGTLQQVVITGSGANITGVDKPQGGSDGSPTNQGSTNSSGVATTQASKQQDMIWGKLAALLQKPGYIKSVFNNKHPLIRSAGYTFLSEITKSVQQASKTVPRDTASGETGTAESQALGSWQSTQQALQLQEISQAVLSVLGDKHPGNHSATWAMLLGYIQAFPTCWSAVNLRKMFIPRMVSCLRHGCYGSHTTSWPALLPLISLLPPDVISHTSDVAVQVLEATWHGLLDASAGRAGRAAGVDAYLESCQWLLLVASQKAQVTSPQNTTDPQDVIPSVLYQQQLLRGSLLAQPLQATLGMAGSPAAQETGTDLVTRFMKRLQVATSGQSSTASAAFETTQQVLAKSVTQIIANAVSKGVGSDYQESQESAVYGNVENLVQALNEVEPGSAQFVAHQVITVLVNAMHDNPDVSNTASPQLPAAASQLLAALIRTFGSPAHTDSTVTASDNNVTLSTNQAAAAAGRSLGLESMLAACKSAAVNSPAAAAHMQLLLAWLLRCHNPQADWTTTISTLSGLDLDISGSDDKLPDSLQEGDAGQRLQTVQLLVKTLAQHLAEERQAQALDTSAASGESCPWQPAFERLASTLASQAALEHAAAAVIMPVLPDGSSDIDTAVATLLKEPSLTLLSHMLTGSNTGCTVLSQQAVCSLLKQLSGLLPNTNMHGTMTRSYMQPPDNVEGYNCAALVVLSNLVLAARSATATSVSSIAPAQISGTLPCIAGLAWLGDLIENPALSYSVELLDHELASDEEVELQDNAEAVSSNPGLQQLVMSLKSQLDEQPWLAVAVHLASSAWGHGKTLQEVASQLHSVPQMHDAMADLASLVVIIPPLSQTTGVKGAALASLHERLAVIAAAHVQEVSLSVASHDCCLAAFLQPVLTLSLDHQPSKQGKKTVKGSEMSFIDVFLPHLLLAIDPQSLVSICVSDSERQPETAINPVATLLVRLLCTQQNLQQQNQDSGVSSHDNLTAIAIQRLFTTLGNSEAGRGLLQHAMQMLYLGGCKPAGSNPALSDMRYSQGVFCTALLSLLDSLSDCVKEPDQLLEQFCSAQLLPVYTDTASQTGGTSISNQLPGTCQQQLLSQMSTIIRSPKPDRDSSEQTCLSQIACSLVTHSASLTPVPVDPNEESVTALSLAVSCFPLSQSSHQVAVSKQETDALLRLLRHQVARQGAVAAVMRAQSNTIDSTLAQEAKMAVAQLQLSVVSYCSNQLQPADWRVILVDIKTTLDNSLQLVKSITSELCNALSNAASELVGNTEMTLVMAIQMFRQLDQKGILSQHPCQAGLLSSIQAVLESAATPAGLLEAAEMINVILHHLQQCGNTRIDQLSSGMLALQQECRQGCIDAVEQTMQFVLAIGAAYHVCAAGGVSCADLCSSWFGRMSQICTAAGTAVCSSLDLSIKAGGAGIASAAYAALSSTDEWLTSITPGLFSTDLLLTLALPTQTTSSETKFLTSHRHRNQLQTGRPRGTTASAADTALQSLSAAAYLSLLHAPPSVTSRLCLGLTDGQEELPDYEQGTDAITYLVHAGLHPQLAAVIGQPEMYETGATHNRLTAWAVLLAHLISGSPDSTACRLVRQALGEAPQLVPSFLNQLLAGLPLSDYSPANSKAAAARKAAAMAKTTNSLQAGTGAANALDVRGALRSAGLPSSSSDSGRNVSSLLFFSVLHALPASAQTWFGDLRDRGTALAVEAYTAANVSPALVAAELRDLQSRGESMKDEHFSVRVNSAAREVTATLTVEEGSSLEIAVKLPLALPLKPPEVECRRRVGVSDTRMRKWLLSISTFLRTNNRGVTDAVNMWRNSVESEFSGVEPCLICYSVIAATNAALPKLQCHTCQVRFHPGCLYKWFRSSGKSACPHCQSPW